MSPEPEERDLAGEATERDAYLRRLRADISPEEAAEELLGDPDEYDFDEDDRDDGLQFCNCSVNHSIEELDWNQCDCCGKEIE